MSFDTNTQNIVDIIDIKSNKIQSTHDAINALFEKYENNPYMFSKTHNYICNLLPNILENIKNNHEHSMHRIEVLSNEQDSFIETFLNTNKYFYVSTTEKFFFYDGLHYRVYNEDDILYNVLSTINRDSNLMSWKQKTKVYVMKRIKDNNLLKSIPESETIQFVLDQLYPAFFSNKIEAKYFLTILGDNILKKNTHLIHFICPQSKHFIRELNNLCQFIIGANLSQSFKYKYHELHDYKDCRLIRINDCIKSEMVWTPILNNCLLDLICVACHYSIRYTCSDDVITDQDIADNVFYLRNNLPESMIAKFVDEYLQISSAKNATISNTLIVIENQTPIIRATQITWKNMQYLWKQFLDSKNLPNIMFQQTLKGHLMDKLSEFYKPDLDSFVGICSKFLPAIQKFLQFWNETIEIDEGESDFEIEEVTHLFRKWTETKNETVSNLNDKQILDLIAYYYPDIEIERDKFISKIRCSLWDKQLDVQVALENMKEQLRMQVYREIGNSEHSNSERSSSPIAGRHLSIYDAYNYYCKFYSGKQIVNKSYFEKYVFENLSEYVLDSKFIMADWLIL